MRISVESGRSCADSILESISIPETAIGLIRHGESSGRLAESLRTARLLLEHGDDLKRKVTSAMAYPVIIGVFATLLTLGLVRGVMPQIIPMLLSLHVSLPLLTRSVIVLSEGFMHYGLYVGITLIIFTVISLFSYKKSQRIRYACHWLLMKVPIVSRLSINYSISVFLQSCGSLIETGSAVADSYAKSAEAIALLPLRSLFKSRIEALKQGSPLHSAFKVKSVPAFIPSLLSAGESSGTLGVSMVRAAFIIDKNMDHALKKLTSLVEPVMMAGMGLVVGAIALSIMLPIYDISKVLQK